MSGQLGSGTGRLALQRKPYTKITRPMKTTTDLRHKLLAILITGMLAACNPAGSPDLITDADGQTRMGLGIPVPIMQVRNIDRNQLFPRVTIRQADNSAPETVVALQRQNDQWVGRFTLPDDSLYTLETAWFYTIGGVQIQLAASPLLTISLASDRNIRIDSYNTDDFDYDSDGVSNIDELNQDRDPLVSGTGTATTVPEPNASQGDCRTINVAGVQQPHSFFHLQEAAGQSFSIPTANDQIIIFEAYYLEVAGTLTIEHLSGSPASTKALLFDVKPDLTIRHLNNDAPTDARATVSASLDAGVYCYLLSDIAADKAPLTNIVIRNSFIPQ